MEKPRHYCCSDIKTVSEWIPVANGIDLALIKKFERIYNSSEKRKSFLNRVFTQKEQEEIIKLPEEKRVQKIAKGFSIKETISKALGTGISLAKSRSSLERH